MWAEKDRVAAYEWAMKQPNVNNRDIILSAIVGICSNEDPKTAAEWLMRLPEGEARDKALLGIVRGWVNNKDQANAKPCVEGLQVSDKLKEELLQECPKR